MQKNVGTVDRVVRLLIGVAIVVGVLGPFAGMVNLGGSGTLWLLGILPLGLLLGLLLLLTGATGRSLVYRWIDVDTTSDETPETEDAAVVEEMTGGSPR